MTSPFSGLPGEAMPRPSAASTSGGGAPQVGVAVVDADQTVRSRLAMQLGQGATPFGSLNDLLPRLTGHPVVVVLGPSFNEPEELAAAEHLLSARREVGAIMVAQELTTDLLQRALRSGVRDVLQSPVDSQQLVEAVSRAALSVAQAAPPVSAPLDDDAEPGRIITVFSTKGGAGKSVIATNLAVSLARRTDRPVVLVDADLQFGDIAVMLKLSPQHTVVDAVGAIDRLDRGLLQNLLVEHGPSGLLVLAAPLEPAFADQIGASEMVRIVELLRSFAAFVVVDTPAYFNDVVLGLIEISDDVLLVAGMDIPNIKNVKIGLQTLRLLNTPMEKLRLILNRANSKVKLDVGEVERTLGVNADAQIPSDVVVPQAVNKGEAVVLNAPKSGVAKSIEELADKFAPVEGRRKRR
ncbi:MAG: P-loop NTPase [Acidimicrobiales bacterium]|nr:P-loop NTPase [Acidimicrobiales bacterium]